MYGCCIGALVSAGVWLVSPMLDSGYMPFTGTIPAESDRWLVAAVLAVQAVVESSRISSADAGRLML